MVAAAMATTAALPLFMRNTSRTHHGLNHVLCAVVRGVAEVLAPLDSCVSADCVVVGVESAASTPHKRLPPSMVSRRCVHCPAATSPLSSGLRRAVGSYTAGQPDGGTGSRTVFVSNVHFAATKDALSHHFNKFGAVLKTLIVTDVSGQPIGSAYIEFSQKESAEQALTLNGTSFMSRILKVVKRNSLEVAQLPGWTRASRGSPFTSRLTRTAYPRSALSGAIRGRILRGGARSLQWKRGSGDHVDAGKPSHSTSIPTGNQLVTPVARSFTYTRAEPKQDVGATV
ncbi:hypothetical protein GUJ93_ZPchr0004g40136 [Zizania palustris]|uniref:RRM domain-containing protein n=1 Tax=Zizania palustris TaxID=103762 RepID=A0A8J5S5N8_ZIZPA|nr:hypothetical protein GUJ93_ZPchr0004g40136 [Zizania palustris]